MVERRYRPRPRWLLPWACALLASCGPNVPAPASGAAIDRNAQFAVPEASPLRRLVKVGTVGDTTVEREGDGPGNHSAHHAFTVPAGAVVGRGADQRVFVERAPWVFEPRVVTTGAPIGSQVEIVAGLGSNERVVVEGARLLSD